VCESAHIELGGAVLDLLEQLSPLFQIILLRGDSVLAYRTVEISDFCDQYRHRSGCVVANSTYERISLYSSAN
jgi:hypothetical protein